MFGVELISKHSNRQISEAYKFMTNDEQDQPKPKLRCDRQLGKYLRVEGLKTRRETSISALHLVSRQIHRECMRFLYGSVTIFAQSSNRLANFLSVVPKTNLKYITGLHLDHQTYGILTQLPRQGMIFMICAFERPPSSRRDSNWSRSQ